MKNVAITLVALILFASCSSLDKMVDQGQYDEAVIKAAKRMYGSKNKKTKHVKVLEEAFAKANRRDLAQAKHFENLGGKHWLSALEIYRDMEARQQKVLPFLPLVSKDGYVADFAFIKTSGRIANARREVGRFYYAEGRRALENGRAGSKVEAREAFKLFNRVDNYTSEYTDLDKYIRESHQLGMTNIFVNLRNEAPVIMHKAFEDAVLGISVADLNDTWRKFYVANPSATIDVNATLVVQDIAISPEREHVRQFEERKEIKDGWEYVLDQNGNVAKDSLGNDIKADRFITVSALISEIKREKIAVVRGVMRYTDARTGEVLQVKPITVENDFGDSTCTFIGDKRALTTSTRHNIGRRLDPFPTDYDMTMYAAIEMKEALKRDLKRYIY